MARERSARVRKVPGRLAERAGSFTHKPPAAPKPSSAPSGASANAKRAKAVSAGGSFARPRKKAAVAATDVPANGSRPRRVTPNKRAHEDARIGESRDCRIEPAANPAPAVVPCRDASGCPTREAAAQIKSALTRLCIFLPPAPQQSRRPSPSSRQQSPSHRGSGGGARRQR